MLYENNFYRKGKSPDKKNQKQERIRKMNAAGNTCVFTTDGNVNAVIVYYSARGTATAGNTLLV
jgi:hypothetical protein